jgi:DNA-binding CsgD family transcriptional regulator
LAYLRERRLEASSSHGGLVLIAGDAGVGKSRLIAEFCGSLAYARCRIGSGQCLEFASRPYGPVLDILARIDARPFEFDANASKQEQFDAILERFAAVAARSSLVMVVEDLHWADAATLDLLAYFGAKLGRMRVLVLASFRPDALHPEHHASAAIAKIARNARAGRIDLGPLRGAELRTFIDEALDGFSLPDLTRREIALAGDGNPFYTEELLKSAVEQSVNWPARVGPGGVGSRHPELVEGRADFNKSNLPATLRETLLERLRPFDVEERRIVTQAAVIGRSFGLDLLATTLGTEPDRLLLPLRKARDFQLIEEVAPAVFRFRHALTREAIYGDFLGAELQPRHRTIASALENVPDVEPPLAALAYHWWAAGDAAKAIAYNDLAGDAAAKIHAHENAIEFYERALEFAAAALVRGSLLEKIAARRHALTWSVEALATHRAAADLFRDAGAFDREATCRVTAAIIAYTLDQPAPTAPLQEMLDRLAGSEYLARSRVHIGFAWLDATFWFPSKAEAHLASVDARALAEAPDIRYRFHNISAWVAMTLGDVDRFRREHAAWVESARAMDSLGAVAGARYNGAMCFSFFGLHEEAHENVEEALRIARESRSRHALESAHALSAITYVLRGDLARARAAVEAVPPDSEARLNIAFASAWGTVVGAYLGDDALIEKWFDRFEGTLGTASDPECCGAFAEILARRGRARDAAAMLHRAIPDCELMRGNVFVLLAAAKYGDVADLGRAREHLARAAAGSFEMVERPALALFEAYVCRRDGKADEAAAFARDAAAGFARLRFPLFEAEAHEVAGDAASALAVYRSCGATYHVRRLESGAMPGRDPASPRIPQAAESLSPREREIAVLAAQGRSNMEIARELSISHKTVEKHLASTYQKLGVPRRMQLAAHVGVGGESRLRGELV